MDWSAIFYIVIGASVGSLIGKAIFASTTLEAISQNAKMLKGLFVAIGILSTTYLYRNMIVPRIIPFDESAVIDLAPYLTYIRDENPGEYRQLIMPLDKATRLGRLTPELLTDFRTNLSNIVQSKKKTAAYETLLSHEKLSAELFEILETKAPHVCTQIINGLPFEELQQYLTSEFIKREGRVMSRYYTDPPRDPDSVVDVEKGKSIFVAEVLRLTQKLGVKNMNPIVDLTAENKSEHEQICVFSQELSQIVTGMPEEDFMNVQAYVSSL